MSRFNPFRNYSSRKAAEAEDAAKRRILLEAIERQREVALQEAEEQVRDERARRIGGVLSKFDSFVLVTNPHYTADKAANEPARAVVQNLLDAGFVFAEKTLVHPVVSAHRYLQRADSFTGNADALARAVTDLTGSEGIALPAQSYASDSLSVPGRSAVQTYEDAEPVARGHEGGLTYVRLGSSQELGNLAINGLPDNRDLLNGGAAFVPTLGNPMQFDFIVPGRGEMSISQMQG